MATEQRCCKDCKWCSVEHGFSRDFYFCEHPMAPRSPDSGKPDKASYFRSKYPEAACGPEGNLFERVEPRPSLWRSLLGI